MGSEANGTAASAAPSDLRVVEYRVSNVMGLKAVAIAPGENGVVIGGRNAQGKSSTLNALIAALGGKTREPSKLIRQGEEQADVVIDLGDIVVEKRWRDGKDAKLVVRSKDGAQYPRPQSVLDALFGHVGADIADVLGKDGRELAETVARVFGLDEQLIENARHRAHLADERRMAKKERDRIRTTLDGMPDVPEDTPEKEISTADLMREIDEATKAVEEERKRRAELEAIAADPAKARERHEINRAALTKAVDDLRERLRHATQQLESFEESARLEMKRLEGEAAQASKDLQDRPSLPDVDAIRERASKADETNALVRRRQEREGLVRQLADAEALATKLEGDVAATDDARRAILGAADIDGLTIEDGGVAVNGTPFDGLSTAERIDFAIRVLIRANPRLKIVLIRDGAFLDDEALEVAKRRIVEAGFQPWIERVGKGDECDVIIEAGEVAEVRGREEVES